MRTHTAGGVMLADGPLAMKVSPNSPGATRGLPTAKTKAWPPKPLVAVQLRKVLRRTVICRGASMRVSVAAHVLVYTTGHVRDQAQTRPDQAQIGRRTAP